MVTRTEVARRSWLENKKKARLWGRASRMQERHYGFGPKVMRPL